MRAWIVCVRRLNRQTGDSGRRPVRGLRARVLYVHCGQIVVSCVLPVEMNINIKAF